MPDLCILFHRDLAGDLLMMIPDNELQLIKLCAFYPGCTTEINDLHEKVHLRGQLSLSHLCE